MMRSTHLIIYALSLFIFSCGKEEINCVGESIPVSSKALTAEGSGFKCQLQNISNSQEVGREVNLIIRSQSDYEKYGLCEGALPSIDFSQNTLLAGRYTAPYMDWVESQRVYQDCTGKVVFEVKLKRGRYTAVTDVYYFAVIPKISSQTEVKFDVSY